MEKLVIYRLGPIAHCEIEIKDFLILTGAQATGKSTIAKSIFFFGNLKNLLVGIVRKSMGTVNYEAIPMTLRNRFIKEIRNNFLQIFGTTWAMDPQMRIEYLYENGETISVSLKKEKSQDQYAYIDLSLNIEKKIEKVERQFITEGRLASAPAELKRVVYADVFGNEQEMVYIPAGRSMITLLSAQINYIYSTMDDNQKRNLDYCTLNYLERILQIKPFFNYSFERLIQMEKGTTDRRLDITRLQQAARLNKEILKGEYRNIAGDERLQITDDKYVKINFASSGQQESVWILNVLFYYMLNGIHTCFIIEEPESHLYPDSQKVMTEFIALAGQFGNRVIITTHSPYVLSTVNNLLYAKLISKKVDQQKLAQVVNPCSWIDFQTMAAFHVSNGTIRDCTDPDYENLQNDVIDGASEEINTAFEHMVDLAHGE